MNEFKHMFLSFALVFINVLIAYGLSFLLKMPAKDIVPWLAIGAVSSLYAEKFLD